MKIKKTFLFLIAFLLLWSPITAATAAQKNISYEYVFTANDKNYLHYNAPENIVQDENTYQLQGIEYDIINTVVLKQPVTETISFENLIYREVPETYLLVDEETGEELELKLSNVEYEELYNVESISEKKNYYDRLTAPQVPDIEQLRYIDAVTNETKFATGQLIQLKQLDTRWVSDMQVEGRFYGDRGVELYKIRDSLIPYNATSPTWQGFEADILAYLGLESSTHRITGAEWTTGFVQDENGRTYRAARFTGDRLLSNWVAIYEAGDAVGSAKYNATALYTNGVEKNIEQYTVKATAVYQIAVQSNPFPKAVAATAAAGLPLAVIYYEFKKRTVTIYRAADYRKLGISNIRGSSVDIRRYRIDDTIPLILVINRKWVNRHKGEKLTILIGDDSVLEYDVRESITDVSIKI